MIKPDPPVVKKNITHSLTHYPCTCTKNPNVWALFII